MIKLTKKIIAFDLDDTLTESKQPIESETASLLCSLAKVKKVVIISGGSFFQIKKQVLSFLKPNDNEEELIYKNLIILPTSGSECYEYNENTKEWEITDTENFPEETRNQVLKVLNDIISSGKYDIVPAIEGDSIIEDRKTQITMSTLGQHASVALKKIWDPKQEKRQKIKKIIEELLPDVSVSIGGGTSIDILPSGFNKAKGLIKLLNKLEMNIPDMLFIGDTIFPGGNDYSVQEAGIESIEVTGPGETKKIIKELL